MESAPPSRGVLRETLRTRRRALPPRERMRAAEAVAERVHALMPLADANHVAGYWAVDGEMSLHVLVPRLAPAQYCLPCIQADRSLQFAAWQLGQPLQPNRYGIPEPSTSVALPATQMDVVLLPLVGFDRRGNRLGSGAGFYDRSFAFLRRQPRPSRPLLVGVAYAMQELATIDAAEWDVPLDYVATDEELIHCAGW